MARLRINLQELREDPVELTGEFPAEDLHLGLEDELMHFNHPLEHELTAELMGDEVFVQGSWRLPVDCECSRCLKPFVHTLEMPEWAVLLPLTGPDRVSQEGDWVDLTPWLREDILLDLPRHPACEGGCKGLKIKAPAGKKQRGATAPDESSGPWSALDKLKL
jgi:uncharacterized protein